MPKFDKPSDEKPNGELSKSVTSDNADPPAANPNQSQGIQQSELKNPAGDKKDSGAIVHKSTGPRTVAGKIRSKYNAVRHGVFADDALLKNESRAKYNALVIRVRQDYQPEGTMESVCIEQLAIALWCLKRCFRAEAAESENAAVFEVLDSGHGREIAAWDQSRAAQPSGGLLRDGSNPFMIQEAIGILMAVRNSLENFGFQKGGDPCRLSKVYGLNSDGTVTVGIFQMYQLYSRLATEFSETIKDLFSPDELKRQMVEALDKEIKTLEHAADFYRTLELQRVERQSIMALVPRPNVMDGLIRRQVQLSREIDRILIRLERLQRNRRGRSDPPSKVP